MHKWYEHILEDQPDAPLVRISFAGQTIIAIRDPAAAEQIIKKHGFTPKWELGYKLFMYMVRAMPQTTHRQCAHVHGACHATDDAPPVHKAVTLEYVQGAGMSTVACSHTPDKCAGHLVPC